MGCPIPLNEKARLEALYQLQILDTAPEVSFDEITKLAAQICDCEFSLISLVDHDRQWFKSKYNVSLDEGSRDEAICAYTILESEFLLVPNASADDRFRALAPVKGPPHVYFYAAAPIIFDNGLNLGAVCVFDSKPRELNAFQIDALKGLSRLAAKLLEGRKSLMTLQAMNRTMIETEKKMARADQIKDLAEIAGGIVHEINSPLTVVKLSIEGLKETLSTDSAKNDKLVTDHFNRLEKATARIQNLTRGLLNFSRDSQKDLPTQNTFKNIIDDTIPFGYSRLLKNKVQLIVEPFDTNLSLECNSVEISQVLINLLNNSCDAVAGLPERWIKISLAENMDHFELSVTDSGSGIPIEVQSKLFQPYFTTKNNNYGTGLGLSICRRIVERHQGTLEIISGSENTQFVLKLPKSQTVAA